MGRADWCLETCPKRFGQFCQQVCPESNCCLNMVSCSCPECDGIFVDMPLLWGMRVSKIWGMQMCCVKVPKTLLWNWIVSTNVYVSWAYLPGWGVNHDQEGGSPRARPFHCTSVGLTPAIISNVDNSTASFLLVGDCVRAIPWIYNSLAPVHELCQVKLFKFNRIFV